MITETEQTIIGFVPTMILIGCLFIILAYWLKLYRKFKHGQTKDAADSLLD
jgi:hypothetical protein